MKLVFTLHNYNSNFIIIEIQIIDTLNNILVEESYTINQGYVFLLVCGSPTEGLFNWFDSNGNEGKEFFIHVLIIMMLRRNKF